MDFMPYTKYEEALAELRTVSGKSVKELSNNCQVLLVFLRHMTCIFCREAMKDIGKMRSKIEESNTQICLVHMSAAEEAEAYFETFDLQGVEHVSDPMCQYYQKFGLVKGNFNQLYGLQVWMRTAEIAVRDPKLMTMKILGDALQMPGMFLIDRGKIKNVFIHKRASDRPDYSDFIECCNLN